MTSFNAEKYILLLLPFLRSKHKQEYFIWKLQLSGLFVLG